MIHPTMTTGTPAGRRPPDRPFALEYGGYTWTPILDEDPRAIVDAIDTPEVEQFLCYDGVTDVQWAVMNRWRKDLAAEAITFTIRDEARIVGWAGLLMTDEVPGALQTSTFLHPDAWGTGLNDRAKQLQWAMTRLLGHETMLLCIAGSNTRSQAAAWKMFPSGRVLRLASVTDLELDVVIEVGEPPAATGALTGDELATLEALLERHPGWHVWRRTRPDAAILGAPIEAAAPRPKPTPRQADGGHDATDQGRRAPRPR
jgi:hypothetical protein